MGVLTPAVPSDVDIDLTGLEYSIQLLSEQQTITNTYLNYIFCILLVVLVLGISAVLWRLIYNTLFKKEIDFF